MRDDTLKYFSQDISCNSVFQEKRKPTNKVVGFIFAASFLLWIVVVLYGLIVPKQTSNGSTFDFSQLDSTRIRNISGFILLSAVFTFIAFVVLRWLPNITKLTFLVFWIKVPCIILIAYYLIPSYSEWIVFYIALQVIGSILSYCIVIILLNKEFHMPEKVLVEACKMVASIPSTLIFALYSSLLTVLLTIILVEVTIKLFSAHITYLDVISIFINFTCGSWTIITLSTLNMMTLNGTFAEYWIGKKNTVSACTIFHLFVVNLRYHIGTAAMHYPLLGGTSALKYLVNLSQSLESAGSGKSIKLLYLYNIVDRILLRILLLGSAATCSMKGKTFYESITYTMTLFMHNPRRVLAICKVLEIVLVCTTGLVVFFTSFSTFIYLSSGYSHSSEERLFDLNSWEMKFWITVTMGAVVLAVTLLQCLCAACCSTMLRLQEEVVLADSQKPRAGTLNSDTLILSYVHIDEIPMKSLIRISR